MANTGIRQLTTVVGGYAKRIWYSLNGTTPTNELMSIDDTGKLKCVSEQITGLAGTGSRMVVADASGNLSASISSDVINSINSSLSVNSGTPTTIFTGLDEDAKYDIFVYIPGYQISQCYISAVLITSSTGAGSCFVQNTTSPSTISLSASGLNLQVTQSTGSVQTVYWKIKKMY